jgi:hypothetical protein
MNEYTKKLMNHFLIGVFAVIPIVVVLQIIIFVKEDRVEVEGGKKGEKQGRVNAIIYPGGKGFKQ